MVCFGFEDFSLCAKESDSNLHLLGRIQLPNHWATATNDGDYDDDDDGGGIWQGLCFSCKKNLRYHPVVSPLLRLYPQRFDAAALPPSSLLFIDCWM